MTRLEPPANLTAQELRIWMDGAIAGREFELRRQVDRHPITDSASGSSSTPEGPSAAPDGSAAPQLRKLSTSEVLAIAEGDYDYDDNPDDWE